ncbi:MAG TPA: CAP domain-containing protein [Candidatus Methylacidiphilales bacterium]
MKVRTFLAGLIALFLAAAAHAADFQTDFREEAVRQINAFRAEQRRAPVTLDESLNATAAAWAKRLAGQGSMEHRSRGNLAEVMAAGGWSTINENLFMTSAPSAAPSEAIAAWKGSSGHRRNLLQPNITKIGLGMAKGANGFYVVFNGAG